MVHVLLKNLAVMMDMVTCFGYVSHYQSQLAGSTQTRVASNKARTHSCVIQPLATEGSSGVTALFLVSGAFLA